MRKSLARLGSNAEKRQSKSGQRFFGNREGWRVPHCACQYHFVIAVWRVKETQSGGMLTAKTAVQIIREQLRRVRGEGGSSVTAESLEQLLDHLDSGQAEKDIAALVDAEKEMALARHSANADAQLELYRERRISAQIFLPIEWRGGCRCSGVNRTP